jgi:hypothetical protein
MSIPNLSAGSGPAAAILIGGVLYLFGEHVLGFIMLVAGIALSVLWSGHFR